VGLHFDQVAHFISQGRHVAQGIGNGERLALIVDRDRRGLAQRIRDGREIPHGIVADVVWWVSGSVIGEMQGQAMTPAQILLHH
jgi:hypothetical protein